MSREDNQPTSLNCFLCGKKNPWGLKMEWVNKYDDGLIEGAVTVPDNFCSYAGVVHGGIVAAILDETAGRAIMLDENWDRFMVTMKLEVIYRRPTPTRVPLRAVGKVVKDSGTRARVEGWLYDPDGNLCAACSATVVNAPHVTDAMAMPEEMAEWNRTKPAKCSCGV